MGSQACVCVKKRAGAGLLEGAENAHQLKVDGEKFREIKYIAGEWECLADCLDMYGRLHILFHRQADNDLTGRSN